MIRPARALLSGYEIREEWLALEEEAVLDPDLKIVDPHHHLWERAGERYVFDDLLADMNAGHDIRATVYVQARAMYRATGPEEWKPLGEVDYVNGAAAQGASGFYGKRLACIGIVAAPELTLGDRVDAVIERMRGIAGDRLKGVRNSVAFHENPQVRSSQILPPKGLMAASRFRAGAKRLAGHGLSLDVWCYQTQLGELLDLVCALPEQTIVVVNHLGGPIGCAPYADKRAELFGPWREALGRLAARPNTRLKLGGPGMVVSGYSFCHAPRPPSSEELAREWKPYVETGIELFGPKRCMFESNFPVDKGMFSYRVFWNACKRIAASASADEKAALFSGTAIDVYRLPREEIMA